MEQNRRSAVTSLVAAICLLFPAEAFPQVPANVNFPEDLPSAVVDFLREVAAGFEIESAEIGEGGMLHLAGEWDGRDFEFYFDPEGEILWLGEEGDEAGGEVAGNPRHWFAVDRLPLFVRDLLWQLAPDFEIEAVEKSVGAEQRFFVSGSLADGAAVSAVVGIDGRLVQFELDHDRDELADVREIEAGLDPHNPDSDGDRYPDGFERRRGGNPHDRRVAPRVLGVRFDRESKVIVASVESFNGCDFQLEVQPAGSTEWFPLGERFGGAPGTVREIAVPVDGASGMALFRVSMKKNGAAGKPGTNNDEHSDGGCLVPASLVGREIHVNGGRRLSFKTRTRGQVIDGEGGEMMITPFAYTYKPKGDCGAEVTLVFNTLRGFETLVYRLTFDADGGGAFVAGEVDDGAVDEIGGGNFTISMNP